ncbi:MAG: flagellar hook-length control protein FliK [Clostridiales bacterium]|nr:flagellar hook-length control protein FliK [Clostridiales bacterium]
MEVDLNLLAYASVQNQPNAEMKGEIIEIPEGGLMFQNILAELMQGLQTAPAINVQTAEDFPEELKLIPETDVELAEIPMDLTEFVGMEYYGGIVSRENPVLEDTEMPELKLADMPQIDTKASLETAQAIEIPKDAVSEEPEINLVRAGVEKEAFEIPKVFSEELGQIGVSEPQKVELPKQTSEEGIKLNAKLASEPDKAPEDIKVDSGKKEGIKAENYQDLAYRQVEGKESVVIDLNAQVKRPAEAYEQIAREIQAKFEPKAPTEFKLQLQPKELGVIDVKLKISNGKLEIDIMAASKKTQMLLTSQVDKLVQNLGLQNVQVESINVNQVPELKGQEQQYFMNFGTDFSRNRERNDSEKQVRTNRHLSLEISTEEPIEAVTLKNQRLDCRV